MTDQAVPRRARSSDAKRARERDILDAARALAASEGVRAVTLTRVAADIGMHKSALLRYFETREQILLLLAAEQWRAWTDEVIAALAVRRVGAASDAIAGDLVAGLVARPLFCDLLAHVPLSLERNVSLDSVRTYKIGTGARVNEISAQLRRVRPKLTAVRAADLIATATSLAGAFWQMATPGPEVAELYRTDPQLAHATVDVAPRLRRILFDLVDAAR